MGFWSALKKGLGIGPSRSGEARRLQKRQRAPSFIGSEAGSGSIASSRTRTSVTASHVAPPTESGVIVNTPSFYPSVPTIPEEIEVIEEGFEETSRKSKPVQPKKPGFWRRFSRKRKQLEEPPRAPQSQTGYTLPSTSDLMHGVAPVAAPSAADSALREQVRETMGLPPRTPRSGTPSVRSEFSRHSQGSQVPSLVRSSVKSPVPQRTSPTPISPPRRGTLSDLARSSPKPPSPPLARQTPRLPTINVPATSIRTSPPKLARDVSVGSGTRKIAVREITDNGTDADAQSIAAMSYLSRRTKNARIFEVAEVINGDAPLSPVSEEAPAISPTKAPLAKGTGNFAAIESWALGHSTRFDMIEEKLQVLKAEILQNKPAAKRRYFSV